MDFNIYTDLPVILGIFGTFCLLGATSYKQECFGWGLLVTSITSFILATTLLTVGDIAKDKNQWDSAEYMLISLANKEGQSAQGSLSGSPFGSASGQFSSGTDYNYSFYVVDFNGIIVRHVANYKYVSFKYSDEPTVVISKMYYRRRNGDEYYYDRPPDYRINIPEGSIDQFISISH